MADDPLTAFTKKHGKGPTASAAPPSQRRELATDADEDEAYGAFTNKVRPVCIELRCHRTNLAYALPYAHMGGILFEFVSGRRLSFSCAGFGVIIHGRNLGGIYRALKLHSCSLIEDYHPRSGPRPDPRDPDEVFVERLEVEALGPAAPKREAKPEGAETAPKKA